MSFFKLSFFVFFLAAVSLSSELTNDTYIKNTLDSVKTISDLAKYGAALAKRADAELIEYKKSPEKFNDIKKMNAFLNLKHLTILSSLTTKNYISDPTTWTNILQSISKAPLKKMRPLVTPEIYEFIKKSLQYSKTDPVEANLLNRYFNTFPAATFFKDTGLGYFKCKHLSRWGSPTDKNDCFSNFTNSGWPIPDFITKKEADQIYLESILALLDSGDISNLKNLAQLFFKKDTAWHSGFTQILSAAVEKYTNKITNSTARLLAVKSKIDTKLLAVNNSFYWQLAENQILQSQFVEAEQSIEKINLDPFYKKKELLQASILVRKKKWSELQKKYASPDFYPKNMNLADSVYFIFLNVLINKITGLDNTLLAPQIKKIETDSKLVTEKNNEFLQMLLSTTRNFENKKMTADNIAELNKTKLYVIKNFSNSYIFIDLIDEIQKINNAH